MLLPDIQHVSGDWMYIFQQDSVPAHRDCATMELLERETLEFISLLLWPPNVPDVNLVDYSVWSILQEKVYKSIADLNDLKHRIRTKWAKLDTPLLLQLSISGVVVFQLVSGQALVIFSTAFNSDSVLL